MSNKSPQISSVLSPTVAYRVSKASLLLPRAFSLLSGATYRLPQTTKFVSTARCYACERNFI
jgi:hypothetical protein